MSFFTSTVDFRSDIVLLGCLIVLASCGGEARQQGAEATPPEGMIYVPGGTTSIGSDEGMPNEQPIFDAEVSPFFLDRHPVTVAQFAQFVLETGYDTEAERFGNAGILDPDSREWKLVDGAFWRMPLGFDGPEAHPDHPVTQVTWHDAQAYAAWAGKRLPTEVEWEHAARGAVNRPGPYAWGEQLVEGGHHRANTWQGRFPVYNTGEDGFMMTSPVGAFGETPLGLTDMGGNVWEWVQDWYRPYDMREVVYEPTGEGERVQRGGSFLCNGDWCHGFRVSARSHSTPETALFHVGFRCARDVDSTI